MNKSPTPTPESSDEAKAEQNEKLQPVSPNDPACRSEPSTKKGCNVCGGAMVLIRGRYPKTEKRETCPQCSHEKLEMIQEMADPTYGVAYQDIKPIKL